MHANRGLVAVTSSTGNLDREGQIVGYRGTGTALDPGRYHERPGLNERLRAAISPPELVAEQLAGIRRMLGLNERAAS